MLRVTRIVIFLGACIFPLLAVGQVDHDVEYYRDSLYQHISEEYRVVLPCRFTYPQGSSEIISSLERNHAELARLDSFILAVSHHPDLFIDRIRLTGYCSIEGSYHTNEQLARERVADFYGYLREHYPALYRYPHDLAWVAEDWNGLSRLIRESRLNEKEEILEIIRKVPGFDERERLLMYLNGGKPYAYIERTMLPQLRRIEIEIEFRTSPQPDRFIPTLSREEEDSMTLDDQHDAGVSLYTHKSLETVNSVDLSLEESRHETVRPVERMAVRNEAVFALKTNLLLWSGIQSDFKHTTPVANVALEYYINSRWSAEIGAIYSYWRYNSNSEFQGISGYRLEPRYRFPLLDDYTHVYLGLYGRVGDYDIRTKHDPASSGNYWDAGVSAGITFRLAGSLGLEVGARAGYVRTNNAIQYTPGREYDWFVGWQSYHKVRITDLSVSLIYKFR